MPLPNASALQVLVVVPSLDDLTSSSWLTTQLRALLNPHYVVQPITLRTIAQEKAWKDSCRLLVIPNATELMVGPGWGYATMGAMESYVSGGGAYLGVGWGLGVFEAEEYNSAMEMSPKEIFTTWKRMKQGESAVDIPLSASGLRQPLRASPSKALASCDGAVLAAYDELDAGRLVVLSNGFAETLLARSDQETLSILYDILVRLGLQPANLPLGASDTRMKAGAGSSESSLFDARWPGVDAKLLRPSKPLPQILLIKGKQGRFNDTLDSQSTDSTLIETSVFAAGGLKDRHKAQFDGSVQIVDSNDTLRLIPVSAGPRHLQGIIARHRDSPQTERESNVKTVLIPGGTLDAWRTEWTPLFNFGVYWSALDAERRRVGVKVDEESPPSATRTTRLGDVVLYGEAVTSTQTMLDKNPLILHNLPAPFISLASFQLSGRGRGSNQWLSPAGCLQFSILLSLPGTFPPAKLIFVQYLMALACCEGLDDDGKLGVRIKWPNDIYAEAEGLGAQSTLPKATFGDDRSRRRKGLAKLGGILVNTSFQQNEWRLVIGCGINVLNDLPTTSISQLTELQDAREPRASRRKVSMEECFAKIVVAFDGLWGRFLTARGFEPFLDEYLGRWLHSEQEVTLTTVEPNIPLRIESITLDEGLLRCVRLDRDRGHDLGRLTLGSKSDYVDLQPDGNSFDLMAGLIRKKT